MKKILLSLLALASSNLAFAEVPINKTTDMVVATVNDQAITLQELKNRITLTKLLINRDLSSTEFNTLKTQAMDQLINEELKRQYAKNKNISVTPSELNKAIGFIEKQRNLPENSLINRMPEQIRATAIAQIKDSILQQKIIQQVIVKRVYIPDYQVNNLLENVLKQSETKEYKISQIKIEKSEKSAQDLKTINQIYQRLTQGENFEDLVAAFSTGGNKLQGGSLGWFSLSELNDQLGREVGKLSKGDFSKPIRTSDGWLILKVDDIKITKNLDTSKTTEYKFVLFNSPKLTDEQIKQVKTLLNEVNGFSDFEKLKKILKDKYKFAIDDNIEWVPLNKVPEKYKMAILNTLPSNFSKVVKNKNNSIKFVYLLDVRTKLSSQVEQIEARIKSNLQTAEAERKFKQFAKDLRDKAFIEIR